LGGIHWGLATDGKYAYLGNSDWMEFGSERGVPANPGLYALDLMSGEIVWKHTPPAADCEGKPGCHSTNSAAPTMIEGVVFAGALDGYIRAYDSESGEVLWKYDTNQPYETVNGVKAHGGAIDGPGPVIANGMLFVNSGYGLFGQMQGNVLLAFSID
jgi:polyvinyl alcohol dehydrogenase (cytochrome)